MIIGMLASLRDELPRGSIVFDNPDFDEAIIGITHDDRVAYDYGKMVDCLARNEDMSVEEAIEWIDYNTIRAIPYAGEKAPIVIYDLMVD